ncbi:MAG: FTR1 family protein [archaeon]
MNGKFWAVLAIFAMVFTAGLALAHEIGEEHEEEPASGSALAESFVIILREGLEAILIIAAIIAYLVAAGHRDKVKTVYMWAGAAILASIGTAFVLDAFLAGSDAPAEFLEGVTMLLAAAVMLYVTNWFLGKIDSKKWMGYIKGKVDDALTSRSALALGIVSFLAVYREGFETVLFFKALSIGSTDITGIVTGFAAGMVALAILFVIILGIEKRLPLNVVFGVTSAILFVLSVKFAGKGVHELQEAHVLPETAFAVVPKIGDLGIYPTVETLGIQLLVILLGAALLWVHFSKSAAKTNGPA